MRNHWSVTLKTIVIAFCLVTEKTQCSPILKSRRSVIDTDTTNRIFLNDPADLIAFEDVDNEIPTNSFPPSPQSFFPIIEDGSASEEYGDKIQFTDGKSKNNGYIRTFTPDFGGYLATFRMENERLPDSESKDTTAETEIKDEETTSMGNSGSLYDRIIMTSSTKKTGEKGYASDRVPIPVLEDWIVRKNGKNITPAPKSDDIIIGFHSLFRLPNKRMKPCPKNFRRNHHGGCSRRLRRIRIWPHQERSSNDSSFGL